MKFWVQGWERAALEAGRAAGDPDNNSRKSRWPGSKSNVRTIFSATRPNDASADLEPASSARAGNFRPQRQ